MRAIFWRTKAIVLLTVLVLVAPAIAEKPVEWGDLGEYLDGAVPRLITLESDLNLYLDDPSFLHLTHQDMLLVMASQTLQATYHQLIILNSTVRGMDACDCICPQLWWTVARHIFEIRESRGSIAGLIPAVTNPAAATELQKARDYLNDVYETVLKAVPTEHQQEVAEYLAEMPD